MTSVMWRPWLRSASVIAQILAFGARRQRPRAIALRQPGASPADRTATLGECAMPLARTDAGGPTDRRLEAPQGQADACRALADTLTPLCGSEAVGIVTRLFDHFGSLPALLRGSPAALDQALGGRDDVRDHIRAIGTLIRQERRLRLLAEPVLPDGEAVLDYLYTHMAHEPAEQVRVLYLDTKNRLLRDDIAARGTINRADIFPREIVRRALELGATGLILAHNHPSGDARPSQGDIAATRAVADAAQLFDIAVHDHIIVGRNGWRSLRKDGHL